MAGYTYIYIERGLAARHIYTYRVFSAQYVCVCVCVYTHTHTGLSACNIHIYTGLPARY